MFIDLSEYGYTLIPTEIAYDDTLTMAAKGMYLTIAGHTQNPAYQGRIDFNNPHIDNLETIKTALAELAAHGLIATDDSGVLRLVMDFTSESDEYEEGSDEPEDE